MASSLFNFFKNIKFEDPKKKNIVLFEFPNPVILRALNLKASDFTYISTALDVIYLGPKTVICFIKEMFKIRTLSRSEVGLCYLAAVTKASQAKVAISTIDNGLFFFKLANKCEGVEFLAIQNGIRFEFFKHVFSMPTFYRTTYMVFGEEDRQLYNNFPTKQKSIVPVGSALMDYYKTEFQQPTEKKYDICLISEWREKHILNNETEETTVGHKEALFKMTDYLFRLHRDKGYSVCVAGMTYDDPREREFFMTRLPFCSFTFRSRETPSSYQLICESHVSTAMFSSCLYEAFGVGEKVLFCNWVSHPSTHFRWSKGYWVLDFSEQDYETFSTKMTKIIETDAAVYLKDTLAVAKKLVTHNPQQPAHKVIRDYISKAVNLTPHFD